MLMNAVSRRRFLGSLAAIGAGALEVGGVSAQTPVPPMRWIDAHHHYVSPKWTSLLATKDLVPPQFAGWTPGKAIDTMDRADVAMAVTWAATYLAGPGAEFGDDEAIRPYARDLNEYGARLVADYPRRFRFFAVLPLPDIDAALEEITYASDTLKADGFCFATSYGDKWLGDAAFAQVFQELERRQAIAYCHPTPAFCCRAVIGNLGDTVVEYGFNTTRAIMSLITDDAALRYPNVRFIFSHAGGTLPFAISRFVGREMVIGPDGTVGPSAIAGSRPLGSQRLLALRQFYYDTAQQANPIAMSALRQTVPATQILFGTDFPFTTMVDHVRGLQSAGVFNTDELRAVAGDNVTRLLGLSAV